MECGYCKGTLLIRYVHKGYEHLGPMDCQCPCVEINRQKNKAALYRQLAETMTNTVVDSLQTVAKLMPPAKSISDNALSFSKRQINGIMSL